MENTYKSIEITTRIGCSNQCIYCPQQVLLRKYMQNGAETTLSFETFSYFLSKIPHAINIHFSGFTEPFLNPDCIKMILHAYEKGYTISLFTTGIGLSIKDIDVLKDINFRQFVFHLPDNEGKTKILVDDRYLSVLEHILSSNIKNLSFTCPGVNGSDKVHDSIISLFNSHSISILDWKLTSRGGNIDLTSLNTSHKTGRIQPCSRFYRNILLPNGDITLCCMDWGLQHILGNLNMVFYQDLFTGDSFKQILLGLNNNNIEILCRDCEWAKEIT